MAKKSEHLPRIAEEDLALFLAHHDQKHQNELLKLKPREIHQKIENAQQQYVDAIAKRSLYFDKYDDSVKQLVIDHIAEVTEGTDNQLYERDDFDYNLLRISQGDTTDNAVYDIANSKPKDLKAETKRLVKLRKSNPDQYVKDMNDLSEKNNSIHDISESANAKSDVTDIADEFDQKFRMRNLAKQVLARLDKESTVNPNHPTESKKNRDAIDFG